MADWDSKRARLLLAARIGVPRCRRGPSLRSAAIQRRFLDTAGTITTDGDTIIVTLNRRAYSPVLRQSDLRTDTTVPWWQNRRLRFQLT